MFAFYKRRSPVGLMPESRYNRGTKVEQIKGDDEDAEISDEEHFSSQKAIKSTTVVDWASDFNPVWDEGGW